MLHVLRAARLARLVLRGLLRALRCRLLLRFEGSLCSQQLLGLKPPQQVQEGLYQHWRLRPAAPRHSRHSGTVSLEQQGAQGSPAHAAGRQAASR